MRHIFHLFKVHVQKKTLLEVYRGLLEDKIGSLHSDQAPQRGRHGVSWEQPKAFKLDKGKKIQCLERLLVMIEQADLKYPTLEQLTALKKQVEETIPLVKAYQPVLPANVRKFIHGYFSSISEEVSSDTQCLLIDFERELSIEISRVNACRQADLNW